MFISNTKKNTQTSNFNLQGKKKEKIFFSKVKRSPTRRVFTDLPNKTRHVGRVFRKEKETHPTRCVFFARYVNIINLVRRVFFSLWKQRKLINFRKNNIISQLKLFNICICVCVN